jgi:hypothetical protein
MNPLKKKSTVMLTGSETKLISLKQTLGVSMKSQLKFNDAEEKYDVMAR